MWVSSCLLKKAAIYDVKKKQARFLKSDQRVKVFVELYEQGEIVDTINIQKGYRNG